MRWDEIIRVRCDVSNCLTSEYLGSSTHRTYVDTQLHSINGLPLTHDPMESLSPSLSSPPPFCSSKSTDSTQSKMNLPDGASPLEEGKKSKLKLGLFSYPVLQAADILVHRYVSSLMGQ